MTTVVPENGFHTESFSSTDPAIQTNNELPSPEEPMQLDITINNVVCSFSVRCHLNLRQIALQAANVEYRRENGMVTMKLRNPYTTASMWSSGKITCTGATSEDFAKVAARKFSRTLQKLGFRVRLSNYRVVNVLGTCTMPFAIRLIPFSKENREDASYEPELHPGVTYRIKNPKATLKIFSTGSITVTAPCVTNVQLAIEHIFPLVYQHRHKLETGTNARNSVSNIVSKGRNKNKRVKRFNHIDVEDDEYEISDRGEEETYADSDQSWD